MSDVNVAFLGSGDAFGSGGRLQTCIFVESEASRFLIDCGASSPAAMKRFSVDPVAIDTIFISHLHGDHFGGLPFFILDAQFSHRERLLTIAGPPGLEARVRDAMEVFFPGSSRTQQRFEIVFVELLERALVKLGGLTVAPYAAVHASGAPAYALRVECDGRTIAYSGDTEWTDSLLDCALGADLFIAEAYFFDKPVKFHLDYATLMRHRDELGCKRLVLTHMSREMLDRLDQVEVETAHDGLRITL